MFTFAQQCLPLSRIASLKRAMKSFISSGKVLAFDSETSTPSSSVRSVRVESSLRISRFGVTMISSGFWMFLESIELSGRDDSVSSFPGLPIDSDSASEQTDSSVSSADDELPVMKQNHVTESLTRITVNNYQNNNLKSWNVYWVVCHVQVPSLASSAHGRSAGMWLLHFAELESSPGSDPDIFLVSLNVPRRSSYFPSLASYLMMTRHSGDK